MTLLAVGDKMNTTSNAIVKVSYTHDAMIDLIIANPAIKQGQIATYFGYTQAWVSRVMSSDAFKARLQERKAEIVDPVLTMSLEEKFDAIIHQSMDVIAKSLENQADPDVALKAMDIAAKARGFGARDRGPVLNQTFVVAMPEPAKSVEDWSAKHTPAPPAVIVENSK